MAICRGLYATLDEAPNTEASCSYEFGELCKVIALRTVMYANELTQSPALNCSIGELARLSQLIPMIQDGHINVLDFGGGCGAHYFQFKKLLGAHAIDATISWTVCETEAMAQAGKTLENDELRVIDGNSLEQTCGGTELDIIFACGSLQYTPNPKEFLSRLCTLDSRAIYVTRTPMLGGDMFVPMYSMQETRLSENGPGPFPPNFQDKLLSYPVCFMHTRDYQQTLESAFPITLTSTEENAAYVLPDVGLEIGMGGMLCRKQ